MKISVIGGGYVGLVSVTCFSEMGNKVPITDNNNQKIKDLKNGIIPIYEIGLESLIIKNINNSNLFFTTNFKEGISNSDIIFIAVGTPMGEDGSADFSLIKKKLKNSIIFDGRNQYNEEYLKSVGFGYIKIGKL
jgi:UDPglucose 6-dehydrogenase